MHINPAVLAPGDRGPAGRYRRDYILPPHYGSLDEPEQSGVGAFQHSVGTGHRTDHGIALQGQEQKRIPYLFGGSLFGRRV